MTTGSLMIAADGHADLPLAAPTYVPLMQDDPFEGVATADTRFASSILIDGDIPFHTRRQNRSGRLQVACLADTQTALIAARDALIARLDELEWELHITIASNTEAWRCYRADIVANQQWGGSPTDSIVVTATFPVDPHPLNGGS